MIVDSLVKRFAWLEIPTNIKVIQIATTEEIHVAKMAMGSREIMMPSISGGITP